MAVRTVTVRFKIGHVASGQKATSAEVRAIVGANAWVSQLAAAKPASGAYLMGFSADAGRTGSEIEADPEGHLTQTAWRWRAD